MPDKYKTDILSFLPKNKPPVKTGEGIRAKNINGKTVDVIKPTIEELRNLQGEPMGMTLETQTQEPKGGVNILQFLPKRPVITKDIKELPTQTVQPEQNADVLKYSEPTPPEEQRSETMITPTGDLLSPIGESFKTGFENLSKGNPSGYLDYAHALLQISALPFGAGDLFLKQLPMGQFVSGMASLPGALADEGYKELSNKLFEIDKILKTDKTLSPETGKSLQSLGSTMGQFLAYGLLTKIGVKQPKLGERPVETVKPTETPIEKPTWDMAGKELGNVYHGSKSKIEQVDFTKLQKRDKGFYGEGFYGTKDTQYAKTYGKTINEIKINPNAKVLNASIKPENAPKGLVDEIYNYLYNKDIEKAKARGKEEDFKTLLDRIRTEHLDWTKAVDEYAVSKGYDIVKYSNGEIVIKNPDAIKPEPPKTAKDISETIRQMRERKITTEAPKPDTNLGLTDMGEKSDFDIKKYGKPAPPESKIKDFKEKIIPKLNDWLERSKTKEDFRGFAQRELPQGFNDVSKKLVDYGFVREKATTDNAYKSFDEYYDRFKKKEIISPIDKYAKTLPEYTPEDIARAKKFIGVKRELNLNLNSVGEWKLDSGEIRKGMNDILKDKADTKEAKLILDKINTAYKEGITNNADWRNGITADKMKPEQLKEITGIKEEKPVSNAEQEFLLNVPETEKPKLDIEQKYVQEKLNEGNKKPALSRVDEIRRQQAEDKKLARDEEVQTLTARKVQLEREIKYKSTPQAKQELEAVNKRLGKIREDEGMFETQNKLFTEQRHEEVKKELAKRRSNLKAGIDPEEARLMAEYLGYYVEKGIRNVPELTKQLRKDLGEQADYWIKNHDIGKLAGIKPIPPVRTQSGETKVRKLAQRTADIGLAKGIIKSAENLPEYDVRKNKPQIEKAVNLIQTDFDRAKRIAMGQEEAPPDIIKGFVYKGLEEYAVKTKNADLLKDLTVSELSRKATEYGQEIQALRDMNPLSPIKAIKDITKARENRAGKINIVKEREVTNIQKSVKKNNMQFSEWNAFINSIKCA